MQDPFSKTGGSKGPRGASDRAKNIGSSEWVSSAGILSGMDGYGRAVSLRERKEWVDATSPSLDAKVCNLGFCCVGLTLEPEPSAWGNEKNGGVDATSPMGVDNF